MNTGDSQIKVNRSGIMSILTVKRIEAIAIDPEEVKGKEKILARLIMAAALRKCRHKRALMTSSTTPENISKDRLDSDVGSDYE